MEAAETKTGTSHRQEADLKDAPVAARERGRIRAADILNGEDMLSAEAFAELPGSTRVTVNTKRQQRQVLLLEGAKRGFRFPVWQVGSNGKPFAERRRPRIETSVHCLKRQVGAPYERPAILPAWLETRAERRLDQSKHRFFMTVQCASPFVTSRPLTGLSVPTRE